jgi:uncharacterized membrane protein
VIGVRLAGVVLISAVLAGCDSEPNNQAEPAVPPAPVVANEAPPANVAVPVAEPKILKSERFSVSRETAPAPATAMPGHDYRAIGTEPFWAVTVRGATATLERPDHPPVRFTVARDVEARTIRYRGEGFAMTISEGPCSDGMSDAVWRDRVAVAFGDGALKGCGGERDEGNTAP